jgi:hypothetical protein
VTNSPQHLSTGLQEVTARNDTARSIINGFAAALPTLAHFWEQIDAALTDTAVLATEVLRLRVDLTEIRRLRADMAAAARACLAAHHDGEPDPYSYLRDELHAQGFTGQDSRGRA